MLQLLCNGSFFWLSTDLIKCFFLFIFAPLNHFFFGSITNSWPDLMPCFFLEYIQYRTFFAVLILISHSLLVKKSIVIARENVLKSGTEEWWSICHLSLGNCCLYGWFLKGAGSLLALEQVCVYVFVCVEEEC